MKVLTEAQELMRLDREWLDPPTNVMARPVELPPMVPIKDSPESDEDGED